MYFSFSMDIDTELPDANQKYLDEGSQTASGLQSVMTQNTPNHTLLHSQRTMNQFQNMEIWENMSILLICYQMIKSISYLSTHSYLARTMLSHNVASMGETALVRSVGWKTTVAWFIHQF